MESSIFIDRKLSIRDDAAHLFKADVLYGETVIPLWSYNIFSEQNHADELKYLQITMCLMGSIL